jgi:SAM-dependent methyltransferase
MNDQSAKNIIDLYERHAAQFDADRSKSLFEKQWLDRFRALLPHGGSVLDMGCGSGEPITAYLIGCGYRVMGVDSSPSMIAMCQSRFPDHLWVVADMRDLHLDQAFDGIIAWDSLFHLTPDDQHAMFPIFRAHAKPGSALMFTSGPRAGEAIGEYRGEPLYHASLDAAEYESLLSANGFKVVGQVVDDRECGGRTIWLAEIES